MTKSTVLTNMKESIKNAKKKVGKGVKETVDIVKDKETGKKLVESLTLLLML